MRRALAALATLALLTGCAPVDGPLARYRLEQKVWRAQFYERRINISFLQVSRKDMQLAIAGFRNVLASDPLAAPRASRWDPVVVHDIRNIQVSSRMALANLYYLSERYADAGDMYRQTLTTGDLSLKSSMEARLGAARALYLSGETTPVMELCADIFRELSQNETFQNGGTPVEPAFMNVPVALVRMYHESGDTARTREFSGLALRFYDRAAVQAPDSLGTALDARLGALQVCLAIEQWPAAEARLHEILAAPDLPSDSRPGLELLLGEIYAFPMHDAARARETLQAIVRDHAGTPYHYAARYDLASLDAQEGDTASAIDALHAIELDAAAPPSVASRAMLTHARLLDRQGNWNDAYVLYRRVGQVYPNTMAAVEAPLVLTRHYASTGETTLARRTLEQAQEYYLSLLDRGSPFAGDRMVVQAALQATFLAAGEAAGVAELLGSGPLNWDEASSAAGMLRSAEVYATALGDTAKAREMLKKCIERFPETRYADTAQRRLDEWEARLR